MARRWMIGLSASAGGGTLDAALVELEGVGLDARAVHVTGSHQPLTADLRELIRRADDARALGRLHRVMGETFAAAARAVADGAGLPLARAFAVGCPGLVVGHDPEGRFPSALPLGVPAVIAERTGLTVISDLAARDVSAGGHGTPLGAVADWLLLRHPERSRLLLHLGGMSRAVWLPAGGRVSQAIGFETGPCGVMLDALVRQLTGGKEGFDTGGKHAVQGRCVEALLEPWLAHPLLTRRMPRALPAHAFADEFARQAVEQARRVGAGLHDLLCTATHFAVRCVTDAVTRSVPPADQVLVSGGGVRNGLVLRLLAAHFDPRPLARTDDAGLPAELRQAAGAAVLAALTLDGVPGNAPAVTGAAGSRLLGSLTPGSAANWSRCVGWMAQHGHPAG